MAPKPKAGKAAKPHRKTVEAHKAQSERFIEAARSICVDESGKEFERAFRKIIPPRVLSHPRKRS